MFFEIFNRNHTLLHSIRTKNHIAVSAFYFFDIIDDLVESYPSPPYPSATSFLNFTRTLR